VIKIKRYCKGVDITDVSFIESCCFKYLDGKWKRNDVSRLFVRFSDYSFKEIREIVESENNLKLFPIVTVIARYMSGCIKNRKLDLQPIKYFTRIDGMNKKERIIGVQEPLHQMFDYVAVEGMKSLFDAKIGVFQCASLPGKGQSYGKKHIERWIKEKKTVYFVKGDISKCFPSIPHEKLKQLLKRDIKNDILLWLVYELIDMFGSGLSIGSYLSQYLSNYYLSYAYHYASEQLFKIRKTKRQGNVRVRLINHVLFYMDDFLLTGSSKKDLKKAMKMLVKYIKDFLGLEVKSCWKVCKISDSEPIDMMGFVFRKDRTTIRAKIFLKTRRYFLEAKKLLKQGLMIPRLLAYRCISGYGWYKNTDSYTIREKLGIDEIHKTCKQMISYYSKLKRGEISAVVV
jgi:RNA-directed DNA polymerase